MVLDKLVQQTKDIQDNISTLREETQVLDEEIKKKEQDICDLKKETQELDLFKFVLDYKIKDLKREVEPRAAEIEEMKIQTLNIDKKLKDLNLVNNMLILFVDTLDEDQSKMQEKSLKKRHEIMNQNSWKKNIKTDIYTVVQDIQVIFLRCCNNYFKKQPDLLKAGILKMYRTYVKKKRQQQKVDNDIKKEYKNQLNYLKKSV